MPRRRRWRVCRNRPQRNCPPQTPPSYQPLSCIASTLLLMTLPHGRDCLCRRHRRRRGLRSAAGSAVAAPEALGLPPGLPPAPPNLGTGRCQCSRCVGMHEFRCHLSKQTEIRFTRSGPPHSPCHSLTLRNNTHINRMRWATVAAALLVAAVLAPGGSRAANFETVTVTAVYNITSFWQGGMCGSLM